MPIETLEQRLKAQAQQLGFAACRIADADAAPKSAARLRAWLDAGHHGDMLWMEERAHQRGTRRYRLCGRFSRNLQTLKLLADGYSRSVRSLEANLRRQLPDAPGPHGLDRAAPRQV